MLPPAQRAALIADLRAGAQSADMADKYGLTSSQVSMIRNKAGIAAPPRQSNVVGRNRVWTPEEDSMVRTLHAAGKNAASIAAEVDRTPRAVQIRLRHLGLISSNRWSAAEDAVLCGLEGKSLVAIHRRLPHRTRDAIRIRYQLLLERGTLARPYNRRLTFAKLKRRLPDSAVWELIQSLDDPTFNVSAFANAHGMNREAVRKRRLRIRNEGWTCAIWFARCPVCGKLALSRSAVVSRRRKAVHPACKPEYLRRYQRAMLKRWEREGTLARHGRRVERTSDWWRNRYPARDQFRAEARDKQDSRERAADHSVDTHTLWQSLYGEHQPNRNRWWDEDEIDEVISRIDDPAHDVARDLGRSVESVRQIRVRLRKRGVLEPVRTTFWKPTRLNSQMKTATLSDRNRWYRVRQFQSERTARRHRDRWPADDEVLLRRMYQRGEPVEHIAETLGRTLAAINGRVALLRIQRK